MDNIVINLDKVLEKETYNSNTCILSGKEMKYEDLEFYFDSCDQEETCEHIIFNKIPIGKLYKLFLRKDFRTSITIVPIWHETQLLLNLKRMLFQHSQRSYKDKMFPIGKMSEQTSSEQPEPQQSTSTEQPNPQPSTALEPYGQVCIKQERWGSNNVNWMGSPIFRKPERCKPCFLIS